MIHVTKPFLPPLEEYTPYLEKIWANKTLTNNGPFHQQLEKELCNYLNVEYISLFANGTLALITALQALKLTGEVITTPFSFVATSHALWWNNIKPVFADIDPQTFNLDPAKIEAAITPKTTAILPVHVYGNPCDVSNIENIAKRCGLKVLYDAAHTFGAKLKNESLCSFGDLSILSFHATKVFNTFEGGAIISHSAEMKQHIDDLKNFGFRGETKVVAPGINAKMNEPQAAMGLLQLKYIDENITKRKYLADQYRKNLANIPGIKFINDLPKVKHNYAYFPIFIEKEKYGLSRDELYDKLKQNNIFGRRYFYPLISHFPPYNAMETAKASNLPISEKIAEQVICLPIYPDLKYESTERICGIIRGC
jgi:dTDP-4-amino-4,6-dideoxygalactose transaminase